MSVPLCPVHKTPLLPEGKALLFCPDCDYSVTRVSLGADGKHNRPGNVLKAQYPGNRKPAKEANR